MAAKDSLATYKRKRRGPVASVPGRQPAGRHLGDDTRKRGQRIDRGVRPPTDPRLKQRVTGALLERTQGRAERLGVNLKGPVTRGQAQQLRTQLRLRREGRAGGEGQRKARPGTSGQSGSAGRGSRVKDRVTAELAQRTRKRQRRLGLPASGPVTKKAAALALKQMRDARGVTVKDGERTVERTQPKGRAEKLTRLGIKDVNRIEAGPGSARKDQEYSVGFDPLKQRYAHVYGEGTEEEKRKYLRKTNPWTTLYGKPQKAAARVKKRKEKGAVSPIGT